MISFKKNKTQFVLILILIFSFGTKIWRLANPDAYIFDEIYSGYTAEQYAKGNVKAFVWDFPADEGFAYNWDHPPLGREIMASSMKIFGINSFTRRIVPMIAGVLLSFVVFKIGVLLFPKSTFIGLSAAFLVSCEGLLFSLSRIGLVDTMLTLFITTSIYFLLKKEYFWSAIFWGMASSCKWTGVFLISYIGIVLILQKKWKRNLILINFLDIYKKAVLYILVGIGVYLLSYIPVFVNFGFSKFIEIQKQAYWYHSRLSATHPAQSPALSWPLNLKPVWFWVDYKEDTIANIYALGNPLIFWTGILAIIFCLVLAIKNKDKKLWFIVLAYFTCWIQWVFSPRIMFLYHYLPAIPFLCLAIAYYLNFIKSFGKVSRLFVFFYLFAVLLTFGYFYPILSGLPVKKEMVDNFRWFDSWR